MYINVVECKLEGMITVATYFIAKLCAPGSLAMGRGEGERKDEWLIEINAVSSNRKFGLTPTT